MTTIETDLAGAVEDAAAHLYVWALKDIPQDLRDALDAARSKETSVAGKRVLETIHRNVNIADAENNLVCQDTGIAVYSCRVGEHFPLHPARIYESLKAGTARATLDHPLRSNAVHTITRENTGPNIGYRLPIVHWEFVEDWGGLDVKCVPKGSGSENMSFLKMCVPADGVKGIKQFVLESIVGAGGKPCPPGILGLRAGDEVTVQGHIIGIRDRTQIRIFDQGIEPPMDLCGAFLLHTAPGVRKIAEGKYEKVCIGTTTSARMVRFTEPLGAQYGVRAICGKGGFPDDAIEPMRKHGMVYFAIVGGAAALETTQIEEIEEVAWAGLMPECLWKFRVKDFGPLTVGIDAHGNSLYHDVQAAAQAKLKELYARL